MATGPQVDSTPVNHPVLGPSVSIYADRRASWGSLFLALAFLVVGLLGLLLGAGDLTGQSAGTGGIELPPVLGLGQIVAALVVGAWAIRSALMAIGRIRHPATVLVGRDGFEFAAGDGPVGWDEVESVDDTSAPEGQPRSLRVQLSDPAAYRIRHSVSPFGRSLSYLNHGDLILGHDTIMPTAAVQALMRKRLAEFRGIDPVAARPPAAALRRAPKRRHPAPRK